MFYCITVLHIDTHTHAHTHMMQKDASIDELLDTGVVLRVEKVVGQVLV